MGVLTIRTKQAAVRNHGEAIKNVARPFDPMVSQCLYGVGCHFMPGERDVSH